MSIACALCILQAPQIYSTLSYFELLTAPQLSELTLRGHGLDWLSIDRVRHVFRGGSPTLSSLHLSNISLRSYIPPLFTITKLSLQNIHLSRLWGYPHFHAVLTAAPLLTELSIDGLVIDHWEAQTYGPIDLPSLRLLCLSGNDIRVSYILLSISMPRVESLTLNGLTAFINHTVFQANSPPAGAAARYPTIRFLAFIGGVPLHRFFEDANPNLLTPWPQLETLTLFPLFPNGYNAAFAQSLCDHIGFRINRGYPLRRLRLDSESWSSLQSEIREKLDVQVDVQVLTQAPDIEIYDFV
jgi:hypothetical protein